MLDHLSRGGADYRDDALIVGSILLDDVALQESSVLLGSQSRGHHVPGRNGHVFVVIATDLLTLSPVSETTSFGREHFLPY